MQALAQPEQLSDEPPRTEDVSAKLIALLDAGQQLATINARELLGLDEAQERLLRPQAQAPADFGFYSERLRQDVMRSGQTATLRLPGFSSYAKAREVSELFARSLAPLDRPALLVSSARRPEHPLLVEHAPCLVICCPIVTDAAERVTYGGFRLECDALENGPEGWTPLLVGRRTLGWVEPQGRALRLRFHPFVRAGRLTTSQSAQRVELLQSVLGLALVAHGQALPTEQNPALLALWRERLEFGERLLTALEGTGHHLQSRLDVQERVARDARTRVDRLVEDLCAALQQEGQAQRQISALAPRLQQTRVERARTLSAALERIEALPQLEAATLGARMLVLETKSLVLQGTDEMVYLEPLILGLALAPLAGQALLRLVGGEHPLARSDGSIDLGETFLPLAGAIADGNLVAACQLSLGLLAAPLRMSSQLADRFRVAAADARPGFQQDS